NLLRRISLNTNNSVLNTKCLDRRTQTIRRLEEQNASGFGGCSNERLLTAIAIAAGSRLASVGRQSRVSHDHRDRFKWDVEFVCDHLRKGSLDACAEIDAAGIHRNVAFRGDCQPGIQLIWGYRPGRRQYASRHILFNGEYL